MEIKYPLYSKPKAYIQLILKSKTRAPSKNAHVNRVMQRIKNCRTAKLGYHLYRCEDNNCAHLKYQYHSCRDRHCPNCGALKKQQWIEDRTRELLPVKYYHLVFTLPHELNCIIMGHRRLLYKLLFDASSATMLSFAKDPKYIGALPGIISVLHTWGQQLSFHPHVHCIVSGGGITPQNTWMHTRRNAAPFLFPVRAMAIVYRAKFMQELKHLIDKGLVVLPPDTAQKELFNLLYQKKWVVFAKAPFAGPHSVIEYLGRYTHKVAISNHRIVGIDEDTKQVTFNYKDYADKGKQKIMALDADEFIRRFEQHILPPHFTKIRTYGYLANRNRTKRINEVLANMNLPQHVQAVKIPIAIRLKESYGIEIDLCPECNSNSLKLIGIFSPWKKTDGG